MVAHVPECEEVGGVIKRLTEIKRRLSVAFLFCGFKLFKRC